MSRTTRWRKAAMAATAALVAPFALVAVATVGASSAAAHGSVTDPPTRNYGCFERWGDDHLNPAMAEADPMCWGAWQAEPAAMWNWNGLYHEGINHRHEELIPDGQLCSGGQTEGGRYDYLDTPGGWYATGVDHQFTLTLTDGANHGADYLRIYVSKPSFDPTTERLGWDDLDLLQVTDSYPTTSPYQAEVDLTGYDGRAVLYTVWQASHADQPYYLCSDINIGGGDIVGDGPADGGGDPGDGEDPGDGGDPGDGTSGDCTAEATITNSWSGGYQADVTVTAGDAAIDGWDVVVDGATINQAWNGSVSGSTVSNVDWNGSLAAGASTSFGFIGDGDPSAISTECSAA